MNKYQKSIKPEIIIFVIACVLLIAAVAFGVNVIGKESKQNIPYNNSNSGNNYGGYYNAELYVDHLIEISNFKLYKLSQYDGQCSVSFKATNKTSASPIKYIYFALSGFDFYNNNVNISIDQDNKLVWASSNNYYEYARVFDCSEYLTKVKFSSFKIVYSTGDPVDFDAAMVNCLNNKYLPT